MAIDRTGYAVLKDIIWEVGRPGYTEATLVNMDGSEYTATVVKFDGIGTAGNFNKQMDNAEPALDDDNTAFPGVSSDSSDNTFYEGYALYRVYTNDDGTVDLDGADNYSGGTASNVYVRHEDGVMIDTDSHHIVLSNGTTITVDDSTEFLVRDADANTYTAYTLSTVPSFDNDVCDIYYTVGT